MSVKSKGEYRSIMNRTKAEQVFRSYTDHYDSSDVKIKLKIDHTFRVAEIADRIAAGIGADRDFAWLSGLLNGIAICIPSFVSLVFVIHVMYIIP